MDLEKLPDEFKWVKRTYKKDQDGKHKLYDTKKEEFIDLNEKGRIILQKRAERLVEK